MQNIIEIKNLNFYDVFSNFNISIESNTLTSISGPNNSGKTTLIKVLSRKIKSNSSITINSIDINNYRMTDFNKIVKSVIPLEEIFIKSTIEEEINNSIDQLFINKDEKNKRLKEIYRNLGISKIKKKNIQDMSEKEFVELQIAVAVAAMPKLLLVDDLSYVFDKVEVKRIVSFFKYLVRNYDISIVLNSTRLEDIIDVDELKIISSNKIILEGKPIDILQKDNVLNKIGINIPFMIDLSVKLRDYNLISDVELNIDRMIEKLWN